MSSATLKTKKTGSSDKYQKIIEAATSVFAQKGFHTAKISDIAKAAQVADGTIYLYFKSKDDLLISVFEYSIDLFIRTVEGAVRELDSPVEKLNAFIDIYFKLIKKYPELAQVIQLELRQSSKFMKEYTHTRFLAFLSIITEILEDGKRKRLFRADLNPHIVRRALFGAMDEIALEWLLMKKKKYTIEGAVEQLSSFFIDGLVAKPKQNNLVHHYIIKEIPHENSGIA